MLRPLCNFMINSLQRFLVYANKGVIKLGFNERS